MKSTKTQVHLKKNEHILAIVPEYCSGPGWSNALMKVHIADGNTSTYRTEALQPDDLSPVQLALFKSGIAMHEAFVDSVVVKREK